MATDATGRVREHWPFAIAERDPKHADWAIYPSEYDRSTCVGYGTTEDDAWRDALARLGTKVPTTHDCGGI